MRRAVPCRAVQPKSPPQPSAQFGREQMSAELSRKPPVCYFCKGDRDDAKSTVGAFIRVSVLNVVLG